MAVIPAPTSLTHMPMRILPTPSNLNKALMVMVLDCCSVPDVPERASFLRLF